ncbi:MAG: hypothetical protein ACXWKG_06585 [Limisphaerales bacterium]
MSSFGIAQDQTANSVDTPADQTAPVADDSNPYSAISKANVFHLTDPPKPAEKPDQALINLPKVNISGFVRHSDEPVRALFATVPKDPKEPARYFNLAEGEKEDILQVTKIYPNQEAVDVIIAGTPVTLTTKSNSFVQPLPPPPKGGVPAAPNPGVVAYNPPPQAAPVQTPYSGGVIVAGGGATAPAGGSSVTTIGSNNGNPGFSGGATSFGGNPGMASASGNQGGSSALRSIPTRGQPMTPNFPPEYHPQSPVESAAMMAIDAQRHEAEIQAGRYPPPPPFPQ